MPDSVVALTTPQTSAQLFAPLPPGLNGRLQAVTSPGDLLRHVETDEAVRLVLIERDAMPRFDALVQRIRRARPGMEILLLAPAVSNAVRGEFLALGVDHVDRGEVSSEILHQIQQRLDRASFQARTGILGRSPRIHEILATILHIGPSDIPVLITGPSGSGKELVARALVSVSPRQGGAFVALNVGALAESVLESELFGHEKGAFTGAVARKSGVFERAHRGTLFLDEVGEMSAHMQVRLLRALESGEITPVGGTRALHVDVRIIAATNRDLAGDVRRGTFREDLYYRLNVVHLQLPGLAERREDIPELVQHFLREASRQYGSPVRRVSDNAMRVLHAYDWPGNVRELRNVVSSLAVMSRGESIDEAEIPEEIRRRLAADHMPVPARRSQAEAERDIILQSLLALRHDIQEVLRLLRDGTAPPSGAALVDAPGAPETAADLRSNEKDMIRRALESAGGNRRKAARQLGMAERTLYRRLREYGLA
jgi:two-component system NtrC family response regulator